MSDSRRAALKRWLDQFPALAGLPLEPASGDASFRRYFRLQNGAESWIAMDAPPELEDSRPFVDIAARLGSAGLNVPEIIEAELEAGFVLMSDLGSLQYLSALRRNRASAVSLYADAMDALGRMQRCAASDLPPYDETLLRNEMQLFPDWLCARHLGIEWRATQAAGWADATDALVNNALAQPRVFVHRDYHSRNLMVAEENPGILDFQDAVSGPVTYDLVSLLRDCYIRWPDEQVRAWVDDYFVRLRPSESHEVSLDQFWRWFELMGVQRHLKAAGIFARLAHRDGKEGYLGDIPRTLGYVVDVASRYPELETLGEFVSTQVVARLETS